MHNSPGTSIRPTISKGFFQLFLPLPVPLCLPLSSAQSAKLPNRYFVHSLNLSIVLVLRHIKRCAWNAYLLLSSLRLIWMVGGQRNHFEVALSNTVHTISDFLEHRNVPEDVAARCAQPSMCCLPMSKAPKL